MDRFAGMIADWDLAHRIEGPAEPWMRPVIVRGLRPSARELLAEGHKIGIGTEQVIADFLAVLAAGDAGTAGGA